MMNELEENKTRDLGDLAAEPPSPEAPTGRYLVVAIGINEYQHHPALNNPINDAQAILALFKQCGFQELPGVPSLVANDATRAAIADLPNRLGAELTPDDNLVVFFAGHGDKVEREAPDPAEPGKTYTRRTGYLIPVDGPKDKPGEWIKLDGFLDDLSGLPARHIFVILDACKSGIALADKFKVKGGDQPTAVDALRRLPSRRVLTSALHNEKAAEGGSGSGHSVFAEALIDAIENRQADRDGNGYIKTLDLFSYVQDHVSDRAKKLFNLKQTPDYGYLPGDGSGDLVISLREGAFNRLIQEALGAMLRHDLSRLEDLVIQLAAANAGHPMTRYLQFRLRFMQGDYAGAAQVVSVLLASDFDDASIPLSRADLEVLQVQLNFWKPLLDTPVGTPPIRLRMLSGPDAHSLHFLQASLFRSGVLYKVESDSIAQFQIENIGTTPAYLYYFTVNHKGQFLPLPLLEGDAGIDGLAPGATGTGQPWEIKEPPGGITETRVFYSPRRVKEVLVSTTTHARALQDLSTDAIADVQMTVVYNQIMDVSIPNSGPSYEKVPEGPRTLRLPIKITSGRKEVGTDIHKWLQSFPGQRAGARPDEKQWAGQKANRHILGGGLPGVRHIKVR